MIRTTARTRRAVRDAADVFTIMIVGFVLSLVGMLGGLYVGLWLVQLVCELLSHIR